jgi:hypothetical protein
MNLNHHAGAIDSVCRSIIAQSLLVYGLLSPHNFSGTAKSQQPKRHISRLRRARQFGRRLRATQLDEPNGD